MAQILGSNNFRVAESNIVISLSLKTKRSEIARLTAVIETRAPKPVECHLLHSDSFRQDVSNVFAIVELMPLQRAFPPQFLRMKAQLRVEKSHGCFGRQDQKLQRRGKEYPKARDVNK